MIISHDHGCTKCDLYLGHILGILAKEPIPVKPAEVEQGLCDPWPKIIDKLEQRAYVSESLFILFP
jgi:hypothetical protein